MVPIRSYVWSSCLRIVFCVEKTMKYSLKSTVRAPSFSAAALDSTDARMLMHKNATAIYEQLSKDGVMVAWKEVPMSKHQELV